MDHVHVRLMTNSNVRLSKCFLRNLISYITQRCGHTISFCSELYFEFFELTTHVDPY